AILAARLGPDHAVARVGRLLHGVRRERLEEARPPRAGLVLRFGREQRLTTTDAHVGAVVVAVPVLAGERTLGPGLARDLVLLWGETLRPLVVGPREMVARNAGHDSSFEVSNHRATPLVPAGRGAATPHASAPSRRARESSAPVPTAAIKRGRTVRAPTAA